MLSAQREFQWIRAVQSLQIDQWELHFLSRILLPTYPGGFMTLGALIAKYGYWLLAADSLLEGETILVLAGFAVRRGHLYLFAVLGIAAVASFVGNQFYFWLGRRHGHAVLVRWPSVAHQFDRIYRMVAHYPVAVIVGIRFVYGLRIAGPVVIGMSSISGFRFGLLNALGAVLWACLGAGAGWVFGRAAELVLHEIGYFEMWLLLGLISAAVIAAWTRRNRPHRALLDVGSIAKEKGPALADRSLI